MGKGIFVTCLFSVIVAMDIYPMEDSTPDIVLDIKEVPPSDLDHAVYCVLKQMGYKSPRVREKLRPIIADKIKKDSESDEELMNVARRLTSQYQLGGSDDNRRAKQLRKYVAQAIEESLDAHEKTNQEVHSKLAVKDKELRAERWKFFAALAGMVGTVITAVVTIVVTK